MKNHSYSLKCLSGAGSIFLFCCLLVFVQACSPFHKLAEHTRFPHENGYQGIYNDQAGIHCRSFGDFQFATSKKAYRALTKKSPRFRNILVYGITQEPAYEYYLLLNPGTLKYEPSQYLRKDTSLHTNQVTILVSRNAPASDIDFLMKHVYLNSTRD